MIFLQIDKLIESYEHIYLDLDDETKRLKTLRLYEEYLQTRLCAELNKIPGRRNEDRLVKSRRLLLLSY